MMLIGSWVPSSGQDATGGGMSDTDASSSSPCHEFLVSKETVVLRRWERSKQKFGFIKRVDKG